MTKKIKDKLKSLEAKILPNREDNKRSAIPDRWVDFARLTKIRSGDRVINFEPYYYQVQLVNQIEKHHTTVIAKTRQLGITETIISMFLHKALKSPGYLAVIFSKNQADTSNLAKRLRRSIQSIPNLASLKTDSLTDLEFNNGGRILFRNSTPNGARGLESVSDILFDESAFVEDISEIYAATIPTTTAVGEKAKIIILSTPNSQTGFFWDKLTSNNGDKNIWEICDDIKNENLPPCYFWTDENSWCKFLLHWLAHPVFSEQKETYLNDIKKRFELPKIIIEQEYNLSFSHSETIVFSNDLISRAATKVLKDEPDYNSGFHYMGIDTASTGDDYFVVSIVQHNQDEGLSLVHLYRENQKSFQYHLENILDLAEKWQPHCIAIESNGIGTIYLEKLTNLLYGFNFHDFKTTQVSKQIAIDRLLIELENNNLLLANDSTIIDEFRSFRRSGKKLGASSGKHDDIVMSLAVCVAGFQSTKY